MTPRNLAFRVVTSLFITLLLVPPPLFAAARVIQERAKVSIPGPTDQRISSSVSVETFSWSMKMSGVFTRCSDGSSPLSQSSGASEGYSA